MKKRTIILKDNLGEETIIYSNNPIFDNCFENFVLKLEHSNDKEYFIVKTIFVKD